MRITIIALVMCLATACNKENPDSTFTGLPLIPDLPSAAVDSVFKGHYLALGDSYTIGQSVPSKDRFPNQSVSLLLTDSIQLTLEIIAQTGWTTRNLLSNLDSKPPVRSVYDMVTLLIGVNNQYQRLTQDQYRTEFDSLLNRSIAYAGFRKKRVFVLSIPDYSVTPFGSGNGSALIAGQIDSFNFINRQLTLNAGCNYLDITTSTRQALNDPGLVAGDGLHPSGREYYKWAALLAPLVKSALHK